jgi:hypothetical protein
MKIKVNMSKSLLESITKEVLSEMKDKKAIHKKEDKKEDLKESQVLNEDVMMDFIQAVKDLDPAALTALGISSLPIGVAIKVIKDYINDPRKAMDKLQDLANKGSKSR